MPDVATIHCFVHHLETERRLSPNTVSGYRRDLVMLQQFLEDQGIQDWQQVEPSVAQFYSAKLFRNGRSGSTIQRKLAAARTFYRYLMRESLCSSNPFVDTKAPKSPRKLPKTLTAEQAARLVDVKGDDVISVRDHAILELFYSSGIRLQELVDLNLQDVSMAQRVIRVTGKGSKERIVPFGSHAANALEVWLKQRVKIARTGETSVFVTSRGNRLTPRSVQLRIKQRAQEQGIDVHVHPHMLRHSFATHVLESSGDIRAIQEFLGHENISTTQIYTNLDFGHLSREYDRTHPRARKNRRTQTSAGKSD